MSENNTDVIPDQISRRRFLGAAGGFAATALVARSFSVPRQRGVLRSTSGTPLGEVLRRLTSTRQRGSLRRISPRVG